MASSSSHRWFYYMADYSITSRFITMIGSFSLILLRVIKATRWYRFCTFDQISRGCRKGNQESPVIMINSSLLVLTLPLFLNLFLPTASLALPASKIKDDTTNQDIFISVMDEAGPGDFPLGSFPDEDGTKRLFILSVSIAAEGIA